jgi:hypothetical protein
MPAGILCEVMLQGNQARAIMAADRAAAEYENPCLANPAATGLMQSERRAWLSALG